MQLRFRMGGSRWACAIVGIALSAGIHFFPADSRADPPTGRWTGEVELIGNYYWERSTRVIAPGVNLQLESPSGVRVNAGYLVDTITSASQASGTIVDIGFTEVRHEASGGLGYEVVGDGFRLRLDGASSVSVEPDYFSMGGSLSSALLFNEQNTTLRFRINVVHDVINELIRGPQGTERVGTGACEPPLSEHNCRRNLSDRGEAGQLLAISGSFELAQTLSPTMTFSAGYDFGQLAGFLASPYRRLTIRGVGVREVHPDQRSRHTAHMRFGLYIPRVHAAVHAMMRGYVDSWGVRAISPELRWYQDFGSVVQLRIRYRAYRQGAADFAPPEGGYTTIVEYMTADPKMTAFHSHLLGLRLRLSGSFLRNGPLRMFRRATMGFSFEHMWSTSRYGDGVIGQAWVRVPF